MARSPLTLDSYAASLTRARRLLLALFVSVAVLVLVATALQGEGGPGLGKPERDAEQSATRQQIPVESLRDELVAPAINLDAPLVNIGLDDDRVLTPPEDVDVVGWWDDSALPGARKGQTVITGHTVHTGGGVLNRLGELEAGDEVTVRRDDRKIDYIVTGSEVVAVEDIAYRATELLGQQRTPGRLVLITCSDWDGEDYQSNTFVFADELGAGDGPADTPVSATGLGTP